MWETVHELIHNRHSGLEKYIKTKQFAGCTKRCAIGQSISTPGGRRVNDVGDIKVMGKGERYQWRSHKRSALAFN